MRVSALYTDAQVKSRVSTEFHRHGIPRNFLTSEVISAQFRRNSAKFRGIPRNFAGIEPEITSVFRGMPKCHFRGHPSQETVIRLYVLRSRSSEARPALLPQFSHYSTPSASYISFSLKGDIIRIIPAKRLSKCFNFSSFPFS
jgi:hypothetical protein